MRPGKPLIFGKYKNIPLNVSDEINLLINGSINEQDVGVAKIVGSSETKTRYFVTYSGVGFDSFMLEKIKNYKWLGKLSYLVCAIMNFTKYKNVALEVVTSKTKIDASVFLLGVGICKYTGGGMQLIKKPKGKEEQQKNTKAQEFIKIDIFISIFIFSIFSSWLPTKYISELQPNKVLKYL